MSQGMLAVLSHMPDLGDIPNSYSIDNIDEFLKHDKTIVIVEVDYMATATNYPFLHQVNITQELNQQIYLIEEIQELYR